MGLDISVFKNVKVTENEEEYDFTTFVIDDEWKYKIKNLEEGKYYEGESTEADVSYSYSAHSRFREELIKMMGKSELLLEDGRIDWEAFL